MRRRVSVRGARRRSVLVMGLGLFAAAGCGVRLDRDPHMPDLSPIDVVRDAVARALAATDASEGTAEAVSAFADAVGPPWDPPADLAEPVDPPNPDVERMDSAVGLTDVAHRIVDAATSVDELATGTGRIAMVLADVAVGALLHLDALDPHAAGGVRGELADAARTSGAEPDQTSPPGETEATLAAHPLAALVTAAHIGAYAYERAAVHLPEDSPARLSAHSRVGQFSAITAFAPTLMQDFPVPAARPAWDLETIPHSTETALTVMRDAEDGLVAALESSASLLPFALVLTWLDDSARARATAGGPQDLRFTAVQSEEDE